jgi:hypothetical protein
MSDVITQFLVGIGVKYDDDGQKKYEDGMSRITSTTLRAGNVISATMAAAGVVIDANARHIANVNLQSQRMSVNARYVLEYGAAVERMGGSAGDAIGQLQKMDQIMDDLHVRGQSGTLNDLAQAGFNVSYLTQATDAQDLQERIANQYQHANAGQRRVASGILGIDPGTAQLYAGGGDYLHQQVQQAGNLENITQDLIDKSAEYNLQLRDAQTAWNGLVNTATQHYLPAMDKVAQLSKSAFSWLDKMIQNHPEATDTVTTAAAPIAIGGAVATGAAVAAKLGIPGAAGVARVAGPVGVAVGGGILLHDQFNDVRTDATRHGMSMGAYLVKKGAEQGKPLIPRTPHDDMYSNASFSGMWDVITKTFHARNDNSVTHHIYNSADVQAPVSESDYQRQAKVTTEALKAAPVQVKSTVQSHLYMDGREIDARIEHYDNVQNQHSVNVNSAQVDR